MWNRVLIPPFKKVRNKAFAHFDLETMTSKKNLAIINLDDLIFICRKIEDIINEINRELKLPDVLFGIRTQDGAMRLVNFLRLGGERKEQIINPKTKDWHTTMAIINTGFSA